MFCYKCGKEMSEDMAFCPKCGAKAAIVNENKSTTNQVYPSDLLIVDAVVDENESTNTEKGLVMTVGKSHVESLEAIEEALYAKDYDKAINTAGLYLSILKTFMRLKELSEQGDAFAQYDLGWMYAKGEGVIQDNAEAVKWFRKAAEQGHSYAQKALKQF
jgi:hypothetical protein